MSRLMSMFSFDDQALDVVESHPLNDLHPTATPPTLASVDHDDSRASAMIHTYPPQPVILSSEESPMETDNPWQSVRRTRDDDEHRSSKLREDVRELHLSNRDILLRKRHAQISSNLRESDMQSVIIQYQEHNQSLQRNNANALASLDRNHRQEVVELQSQIRHANTPSPTSAPAWRHLVGKKPVATCTNIIGFAPIPDVSSESDTAEEPQTTGNGPPLTSLLGDVPIAHATVGMLAEALAKVLQIPQTSSPRGPRSGRKPLKPPVENFTNNQRRDNKANIRELFKTAFHATKDEEYMLHVRRRASREAILSFADETGPGPDPLPCNGIWRPPQVRMESKVIHSSVPVRDFARKQWMGLDDLLNQRYICIEVKFGQCASVGGRLNLSTSVTVLARDHATSWRSIVDQTNERLGSPRVLTRRTTKFETRKKVTSTLLSDRIATGKDDQAVWAYLQSMLEKSWKRWHEL
ncbi:hypothetical protein EDD22DRAFT_960688 [Suillus occidentalis]|nr:hypothetical protein EDD22DRAFT_960688 [Suillus occidentalis]